MAEYLDVDPYKGYAYPNGDSFIVENQLVFGKIEPGAFVHLDSRQGPLVQIEFDYESGNFVFLESFNCPQDSPQIYQGHIPEEA